MLREILHFAHSLSIDFLLPGHLPLVEVFDAALVLPLVVDVRLEGALLKLVVEPLGVMLSLQLQFLVVVLGSRLHVVFRFSFSLRQVVRSDIRAASHFHLLLKDFLLVRFVKRFPHLLSQVGNSVLMLLLGQPESMHSVFRIYSPVIHGSLFPLKSYRLIIVSN